MPLLPAVGAALRCCQLLLALRRPGLTLQFALNITPLPHPHSKAHIESEQLLDFVKGLVADVPDLPPPGEEDPAAAIKSPRGKRPRPTSDDGEGAPLSKAGARGRGRGRGCSGVRGRAHGKRLDSMGEGRVGLLHCADS